MQQRWLIACECSGVVREAFIRHGHYAMSCDLKPSEDGGNHYEGDVIDDGWSGMIAHPPCTYLTCTRNRYYAPEYDERFPTQHQDREDAIEFFMRLVNADIPRIAIENPVGIMSSRFRPADQIVHPFWFGDKHAKSTGLWLKGLPLLVPTNIVQPEYHYYKDGRRDPKWHVDSIGMPKEERTAFRSRTFEGFAEAMASQWGDPHNTTLF